jgi:hypothetical protein
LSGGIRNEGTMIQGPAQYRALKHQHAAKRKGLEKLQRFVLSLGVPVKDVSGEMEPMYADLRVSKLELDAIRRTAEPWQAWAIS